jgi:sulfoxide reductase heme-binding subunit YedZ
VTHWLRRNWHRALAHALALAPLAVMVVDHVAGRLSALPERAIMLRTGSIGLVLLVASLACTPVSNATGWNKPRHIRRALGLYGFVYVCLHVLVYAVFENLLELDLILRDLEERRAMLIGLLGWLALIPLAVTSTSGWQRRLGARWRMLHRLAYVAAALSVLHYLMLDRDFIETPAAFAVVIAALLLLRLPPVQRVIARVRRGVGTATQRHAGERRV